MKHGFIGLGVTECFPHQSRDGLRIIAEGINIVAQLPGNLLLFFLLGIQPVYFPANSFVLLDEWKVFFDNEEHDGRADERDYRFREPVPNVEFNFHPASLRAGPAGTKADFIVFARFMR